MANQRKGKKKNQSNHNGQSEKRKKAKVITMANQRKGKKKPK